MLIPHTTIIILKNILRAPINQILFKTVFSLGRKTPSFRPVNLFVIYLFIYLEEIVAVKRWERVEDSRMIFSFELGGEYERI